MTTRHALIGAAVVGLIARLAFGLLYWVDKPLTRDEREYLSLARSLAAGRGFVYDADLADNDSFEQWRDAGSRPADLRADARWKALLKSHTDPALDPATDEALLDFMNRKKQSMADAWY